jgi:hypothetical protein
LSGQVEVAADTAGEQEEGKDGRQTWPDHGAQNTALSWSISLITARTARSVVSTSTAV